ncbi:MAG: toprim domain-containing protein, partial [Reyranella sp.]
PPAAPRPPAARGSAEAARRLWAIAKPLAGTLAEAYLLSRRIEDLRGCEALRFHPRCWYRGDDDDSRDQARNAWPALISAVTALDGTITGVHRTWLDPASACKAPVSTPRRAMGLLLGNAVRFGRAVDAMIAGEGLETILSLRQVMPSMPAAAALSANHLAALELPAGLRRLYLARDDDAAGRRAAEILADRARAAGVEALTLVPALDDFNGDLHRLGAKVLSKGLCAQLAPGDRSLVRSA